MTSIKGVHTGPPSPGTHTLTLDAGTTLPFRVTAAMKPTLALLIALIFDFTVHAAEPWPDPVANDVLPYETAGLTHGPMLGRPAANSMRGWVRTAKPVKFEVVCDTKLPLDEKSPTAVGETAAARDNTGVVDLAGLVPDTRYFYGVRIEGRLAAGTTLTPEDWLTRRRSARWTPAGHDDGTLSLPPVNPWGILVISPGKP